MPKEIGIDFGTSKTVLLHGQKIILERPSLATVETDTWEPVCFGKKAASMVGRTPDSLTSVFPVEHGAVADPDIAQAMMCNYMKDAFGSRIFRPRVIATMPVGVTSVQHRSMANAIEAAGGRNVCIIETPFAAAIGVGIDFTKAEGNMVVDIGAGTTDIATLSLGGLAECNSVKIASFDFDEAIIKQVRKQKNVLIGRQTAEEIKKQIGSAVKRPVELTMSAKGRNLITGLPETFEITSDEVFDSIHEVTEEICKAVQGVLEKTAPDLVSDIMNTGIHLTGGGALLFGMNEMLSEYVGIPVHLAEDPAHSVATGVGIALKNPELLKNGDYQFRFIKDLIVE